MKRLYFFVLFVFQTLFCFSQETIIDSLELQIKNPTNGKSKLENLIKLGEYYKSVNPEKGILYLDRAIGLAKVKKDSFMLASAFAEKANNYSKLGENGLADSLYDKSIGIFKLIDSTRKVAINTFNKSLLLLNTSNFKEASKSFEKSIQLYAEVKDTLNMGFAMGILAYQYMLLGDYTLSMKMYKDALILLEKNNQQESMKYAMTKGNMASLFQRLNKFDETLQLYLDALKVFKENDRKDLIAAQNQNIGLLYYNKKKYKTALGYFQTAYETSKKIMDTKSMAANYSNLGSCYLYLNNYEEAINHINSALELCEKLNNRRLLALNYHNKGKIYYDRNNYSIALDNFNQALQFAKLTNDKRFIFSIKEAISSAFSKMGNYKNAYNTLNEVKKLKDSLLNDEKKEELAVLKAQYKFDAEKQVLQANFEKEQALEKANTEKQILIRNTSILSFILLLLFLGLVFFLWRKQQKAAYTATLSSYQLRSLKAQMNPHFIYNSLNSIKDFVFNNSKESSGNYIAKFSMMMRRILENTEEEDILLYEEIDFLKNYVALEQERLSNQFSFSITVAENINPHEVYVIPSLLQLFIENSIWHGLSKKEDGILTLNFTKTSENLICTIVDNGKGLSKEKNNPLRKSFAIENVKDRLRLLNQSKKTATTFTIRNNEEGGVTVIVKLPLIVNT